MPRCPADPSTVTDDDTTSPPRSARPHRISTRELFGGRREIEIEHNGEVYRLRITQRGRLILTK